MFWHGLGLFRHPRRSGVYVFCDLYLMADIISLDDRRKARERDAARMTIHLAKYWLAEGGKHANADILALQLDLVASLLELLAAWLTLSAALTDATRRSIHDGQKTRL